MQLIEISSIKIGPRQRVDLGDLTSLKASLKLHGQLNPIILTDDLQLVAGERRLTAAKELGWTHIQARLFSGLLPHEQQGIELDENIKRKQLTWLEEAKAVTLYQETSGLTAEELSNLLGVDKKFVYMRVAVAEALPKMPELETAEGITAAYNLVIRKFSRAVDAEIDLATSILDLGKSREGIGQVALAPQKQNADGTPPSSEAKPLPSSGPVYQADFIDWVSAYSGPPFNFIHCDFPYGINMDKNKLQGTRSDLTRYEDSEELYSALIEALFTSTNIIASSAHVFFWLSPQHLSFTRAAIGRHLGLPSAAAKISTFPLIWHKSDLRGLLPDPEREGRRTYEMALQITFGDRKIVRATAISCALPTERADSVHLSEKPAAVCEHFLKMYVDGSSRVLDPTCGSGNALAVAAALGAEHVLGLDIDPVHVATANGRVQAAFAKRAYVGPTTLEDLEI